MPSAREAVKRLRIDFERLLIPGRAYFPLLATIHRTKRDPLGGEGSPDLKAVQDARSFFSHMLFMGAVLECNGDQNWYDVHPAVQEIEAFRDVLAQA